MRKNTARHWLHAALDLLPVILIPVFMIYSHRHTIDSGSIEVQEKVAVDFNQLVQPRSNLDSSITYENNIFYLNNYSTNSFYTLTGGIDYNPNHKYLYNVYLVNPNNYSLTLGNAQGNPWITNVSQSTYNIFTNSYISGFGILNLPANNGIALGLNIFDLTQMFGSGNEPTKENFKLMFPDNVYSFVESQKMLVDKPTLTTYNDTDIMSQFTYQMYNAVDKYFNMGNVFNLGNVYQWFELNIFGGSAPLYIYIVWNIVLYEFVMDLLFLLYALFMWFIDMCKRLMDKPLDSIK